MRRRRWQRTMVAVAIIVAVLVSVGSMRSYPAAADAPVEGSQGTDTASPPTDSQMTISGADALGAQSPFANLQITVNQTKNLSNQAISVTWSGGTPTDSGLTGSVRPFDADYLQIFECWGPDDRENPLNPGPSPVGCEFGANMLSSSVLALSSAGGDTIGRGLPAGDTSPGRFVDPNGSGTFMPFQPVDGSAPINVPTGPPSNPAISSDPVWANPFFDLTTTNEIDYSKTFPDGTGSELFTVDTGLEAPGLGCGEQVTQPTGPAITPQCWLVVVPRGTPATDNPAGGPAFVDTPPLSAIVGAHRIAFPLSFNSIGSSCRLGSNERRIVGSELAVPAVTNWSPTLCASPTSPPYQFSPVSDDQARQQLPAGTASGGPGMAVVSQPVSPDMVDPADPPVYAPLTLSAVVIGFNVDRLIGVEDNDPAELNIVGERVADINLTPRLVAKLLTESYVNQFFQFNPSRPTTGHDWLAANPISLGTDPDFLQFNPEFRLLQCEGIIDCGGLIVEQPTADAATLLWRWVLADPEARAWLNGTPDPWGMVVNPLYSTNAKVNPSHVAFGVPTPESYPKSDPYTYQNPTQLPAANNQPPRPLGMQDFLPYALSMQTAALETRAAADGSKLNLNLGAVSPDTAWTASDPQPPTHQFLMSVTDSADAAQYGLQTASLSRAGDDGTNRMFVAPDLSGIEAGEQAMTPSIVAGVLQTDVSTTFPGAYPLSTITYATLTPPSLDKGSCGDYAAFITYAAGPGQSPGTAPGDLPPGYAPLPPPLSAQADSVAHSTVTHCASLLSAPSPATSPSLIPVSVSGPSSSSGSSQAASGASGPPTASPPAAPTTTAAAGTSVPSSTLRRVELQTGPVLVRSPGRTVGSSVGVVRFVVPILLGVGLIAALAARWSDVWRRRMRSPKSTK